MNIKYMVTCRTKTESQKGNNNPDIGQLQKQWRENEESIGKENWLVF